MKHHTAAPTIAAVQYTSVLPLQRSKKFLPPLDSISWMATIALTTSFLVLGGMEMKVDLIRAQTTPHFLSKSSLKMISPILKVSKMILFFRGTLKKKKS